jgi:hypothetical protein
MRTVDCDRRLLEGRWERAREFWNQALLTEASTDDPSTVTASVATSYVHAGIAAADTICCARLGRHSRGENHDDAVQLLLMVDRDVANALRRLLRLKSKAAYTAERVSSAEMARARRAAGIVMDFAAGLV